MILVGHRQITQVSKKCKKHVSHVRTNERASFAAFSLLGPSLLCFLCYKESSLQWEKEIHRTP